jgi:hypothetical protein
MKNVKALLKGTLEKETEKVIPVFQSNFEEIKIIFDE